MNDPTDLLPNASHIRPMRRLLLVTMLVSVVATLAPSAPAVALSPKAAEVERKKDLCRRNGLEVVVEATAKCSHGEDPPPQGKQINKSVKPVSTAPAAELGAVASDGTQLTPGAPTFTCDGDGATGFRTQVLYVRASDRTDRYATYKASSSSGRGRPTRSTGPAPRTPAACAASGSSTTTPAPPLS